MDFSKSLISLNKHPLKTSLNSTPVSQALIDRLKIQTMINNMKNESKESLHNVETCQNCHIQEGDILKQQFLRKCQNTLDRQAISVKIENHMLRHNSVSLIGDIAATLPKPSESSDVIWNKLLQKVKVDKKITHENYLLKL